MQLREDEIFVLAEVVNDYIRKKGGIAEQYADFVNELATAIYDAGYRMKLTGIKWFHIRGVPHCSECDWHPTWEMMLHTKKEEFEHHFCPECGAEMEMKEEL